MVLPSTKTGHEGDARRRRAPLRSASPRHSSVATKHDRGRGQGPKSPYVRVFLGSDPHFRRCPDEGLASPHRPRSASDVTCRRFPRVPISMPNGPERGLGERDRHSRRRSIVRHALCIMDWVRDGRATVTQQIAGLGTLMNEQGETRRCSPGEGKEEAAR
jgi:hypothetical protein